MVITPGAGCSIRSTTTVSTTGFFTRRTTFGAAFFTGAGLGLALATVRFVTFAALATLRALPRLAELCRFARFCTFARFLRLAMIDPLVLRDDTTVQVAARYQTRVINRSQRVPELLRRSYAAKTSECDKEGGERDRAWVHNPTTGAIMPLSTLVPFALVALIGVVVFYAVYRTGA